MATVVNMSCVQVCVYHPLTLYRYRYMAEQWEQAKAERDALTQQFDESSNVHMQKVYMYALLLYTLYTCLYRLI